MNGFLQVVTARLWSSSFSKWFRNRLLLCSIFGGYGSEIWITLSRRAFQGRCGAITERWHYGTVARRGDRSEANLRWFRGGGSRTRRKQVGLVWGGHHLLLCDDSRRNWKVANYGMRCQRWMWCWYWTRHEECREGMRHLWLKADRERADGMKASSSLIILYISFYGQLLLWYDHRLKTIACCTSWDNYRLKTIAWLWGMSSYRLITIARVMTYFNCIYAPIAWKTIASPYIARCPSSDNNCTIVTKVNNLTLEKRNKRVSVSENRHFTKCALPDVLRWKQLAIGILVRSMDMKNVCILCLWQRKETFWQVVVCKSLLIGNICLQQWPRVGSDGIRLWYMKNQSQLKVPGYNLAQRGAVTCVRWITRPCDAEEILCYGTAIGYVGVWVHQPVSRRLCASASASDLEARVGLKNWVLAEYSLAMRFYPSQVIHPARRTIE